MNDKKLPYEKPTLELVEFELKDNIANSGETEGAGLSEGLFN